MNNFVTIKHINSYKRVSYYSICFEGEEDSLFEEFMKIHNQKDTDGTTKREFIQIMAWLQKIGKEIGAQPRYFRHEGATSDAKALPPPARYIEGETGKLRLYCMVCSENVVFLYNGGIKTTNKAQDCPNVARHFRLANKLTKSINEAFANSDIRWNEDDDNILFEEGFELEI